MNKKVLLLINPYSGKAQIKNYLLDIVDLFIKDNYEVSVHITQEKGDATTVAYENALNYNLIVCSGGDGTLNEVVNGLMPYEHRPMLGYIPAGTTNDFANSLGLPKNMLEAAKSIVKGTPFLCDMGSFNDSFFTYIAAFGIFTDVSYETPQEYKNILGHLAYILEGIKRLYTIKSYFLTVKYDDITIEDDFIFGMITSSTSVGGFKGVSGHDIRLDDGIFEVALVKRPKNAIDLQATIATLLMQEPNPDYVYFFKTSVLTIHCDDKMPWTLDGEYGGAHEDVFIKNNIHAMKILK